MTRGREDGNFRSSHFHLQRGGDIYTCIYIHIHIDIAEFVTMLDVRAGYFAKLAAGMKV